MKYNYTQHAYCIVAPFKVITYNLKMVHPLTDL